MKLTYLNKCEKGICRFLPKIRDTFLLKFEFSLIIFNFSWILDRSVFDWKSIRFDLKIIRVAWRKLIYHFRKNITNCKTQNQTRRIPSRKSLFYKKMLKKDVYLRREIYTVSEDSIVDIACMNVIVINSLYIRFTRARSSREWKCISILHKVRNI